jgi:transposase-like protein
VNSVLTDDERHSMILEAIKPGAKIAEIAARYGVSRNAVYGNYLRAVRDPEGQWRRAQAEAEFRRKVYEMTR